MQLRPANGRRCDLHDGIVPVQIFWDQGRRRPSCPVCHTNNWLSWFLQHAVPRRTRAFASAGHRTARSYFHDVLSSLPAGCPSVVITSPVSIICLNRRRSILTVCPGSLPNHAATAPPPFQAGGNTPNRLSQLSLDCLSPAQNEPSRPDQ